MAALSHRVNRLRIVVAALAVTAAAAAATPGIASAAPVATPAAARANTTAIDAAVSVIFGLLDSAGSTRLENQLAQDLVAQPVQILRAAGVDQIALQIAKQLLTQLRKVDKGSDTTLENDVRDLIRALAVLR
ncbi:hypothetical protein GCM10027169_28510 [Gordonia jinhuaensis]|uniref:Uncharacterized protein n=1 Tax=Gordonia jinhuaensis TaxID=1517702 RepID=A0A916WVS6_9ACTN|nr:hypothetical protein [Gordonia jinhuaensis]GGB36462.1 hypothetical protein GCM10011489_25470 [Gordonia jinhuaensis]